MTSDGRCKGFKKASAPIRSPDIEDALILKTLAVKRMNRFQTGSRRRLVEGECHNNSSTVKWPATSICTTNQTRK
jgi:hypothetical protein